MRKHTRSENALATNEREHLQMRIGYIAAIVSLHTGREIPAIVAESEEKTRGR